MRTIKGYPNNVGYMGWIDEYGDYMLFSTESDYIEYLEEMEVRNVDYVADKLNEMHLYAEKVKAHVDYVADKLNEMRLYKDVTMNDVRDAIGLPITYRTTQDNIIVFHKKQFPLWTEIKDVKELKALTVIL